MIVPLGFISKYFDAAHFELESGIIKTKTYS
jgi:hypothetical protein